MAKRKRAAYSADLVDQWAHAQEAIFDHCGFTPNASWRLFPLVDMRDVWWLVHRARFRYSPRREAMEVWLADTDALYPEGYGDVFYTSELYVPRHAPEAVFRGETYTLVLEDTNTDGNVVLAIVRSDRELVAPPPVEISRHGLLEPPPPIVPEVLPPTPKRWSPEEWWGVFAMIWGTIGARHAGFATIWGSARR